MQPRNEERAVLSREDGFALCEVMNSAVPLETRTV